MTAAQCGRFLVHVHPCTGLALPTVGITQAVDLG
jgi:hypothetical protein